MVRMSALDAALNAVWAMEEQALESLLAIAARENDVSPEALDAYASKTLANAQQARVRDGVAVLDAVGPLFKRANIFTAISGATSYTIMRADLQAALDDPKVKAIVLNIDSPGGEASGTAELAQAIYDARGTKPIVAYVGGNGASAAYWIASAADRVVVSSTAVLGSIGVQVAYRESEPKAGEKVYRFVSSQSPNKNPELGTEAATSQIQQTIDAMASVFVADVARNRGVATETVLSDFGKGGIFVGQMAVEAGLADSIGTFEAVLAELSATGRRKSNGRKGATMDEQTFTAAERDAAVAAATTAERERVAGLNRLATAHNANAKLAEAITANTSVADFALALADDAAAAAAAAEEAGTNAEAEEAKRLAALKTDEEAAEGAAASTGTEPEGETADSVAARIIAA